VSFGYFATAFGRRSCASAFFWLRRCRWNFRSTPLSVATRAAGFMSGFTAVAADAYPHAHALTGSRCLLQSRTSGQPAAPYAAGAHALRQGFGTAFHFNSATLHSRRRYGSCCP